MYANETGFLLAAVMGKDTISGAGDPYTHTLDLTVDALPYLTAEASFFENQLIDRVADTKIAKLMIEAAAGSEALVTFDLLGGAVAMQGSGATVAFSNTVGEGPMMMHQATLTLTGPTDASTLQAQVRSFSITIDPMVKPEYGPGSYPPIAQFEQARLVTFKMEALFSGPNMYKLTHMGSSSGTAQSAVVGTGSFEAKFTSQATPERSIDLTCGYLNWKIANPVFSPDGKTGVLSVEAVGYRSGSNYPLSAVIKNGVATQFLT